MNLFGAGEMARSARENAARAEQGVAALNVRLDGIITEWSRSWQGLRDDMRRMDENRTQDQKEWRDSLGKRLDSQDQQLAQFTRGQWIVTGLVVSCLLTIIGWLISHLPVFAHL